MTTVRYEDASKRMARTACTFLWCLQPQCFSVSDSLDEQGLCGRLVLTEAITSQGYSCGAVEREFQQSLLLPAERLDSSLP